MSPDKPLPITKAMVWKAYQQVKRNGNAAGVDGQSLDDFANSLRIWRTISIGYGIGWHPGVTSRRRFGDFQESCHSLAAIQAALIKGSSRTGSGSSVGLFIHTSAG